MKRDKKNSNSIYLKNILHLFTNINVFLLKTGIKVKLNSGKETNIITLLLALTKLVKVWVMKVKLEEIPSALVPLKSLPLK